MLTKSFSTNFAAVDEIILSHLIWPFYERLLTFGPRRRGGFQFARRWQTKPCPPPEKLDHPDFYVLVDDLLFFLLFFFFFNLNFQNFYEKNMIEEGLNPRLFPTIPHYPFDHGSRSEDYLDCKSYASMITIVSIFFSLLLGLFFKIF